MDYTFPTYADSKKLCDIHGWINIDDSKPHAYDLVFIKTDGGSISGWWTGSDWDGLYVDKKKDYKFWRRNMVKENV